MRKYQLLLLFCLFQTFAFAQTGCDTIQQLVFNSYQCRWKYFTLEDTIKATVVKASQGTGMCGVIASASVTIVKTEKGDTIRIIALCDNQRYSKGQKVTLIPAHDPGFSCHIPYAIETVDASRKIYVYRTNEYDETVMKTTWATIVKISYKPKKGDVTFEF